jgi:hypothetical protein
LPPSLGAWLPESHLAWFVIEAVGAFDLSPFYASYRQDGWGRAAHDPAMMLALLLYAYAVGERSSRADRAASRGGRRVPGDHRQAVPTTPRSRASGSATSPRSLTCCGCAPTLV